MKKSIKVAVICSAFALATIGISMQSEAARVLCRCDWSCSGSGGHCLEDVIIIDSGGGTGNPLPIGN